MSHLFSFFTPNLFYICFLAAFNSIGQDHDTSNLITISEGFAKFHVNSTIFRKNSISIYNNHQYVAFYDKNANVILAKRKLDNESWEINKTQYKGSVKDAHNIISLIHDGDGYLHMDRSPPEIPIDLLLLNKLPPFIGFRKGKEYMVKFIF